jgi:uncharacterized oligopeptide transporter (OPT) family protein
VLAVAVGIYLPFELATPIFLGGLIAWLTSRRKPGSDHSITGVLVAAGLITGEALIGIFIAIPIVISGDPDVLAIDAPPFAAFAGMLVLVCIAIGLWRASDIDSN